jgi:glycosyltransferase involved in cell wall biosynthesis
MRSAAIESVCGNEQQPVRSVKHILILSNAARTLVRFRGHLIQELVGRGHRVTAAAGESDEAVERTLTGWGVEYRPVNLGRTGMNPLADLSALAALVRLMRSVRPDIFFCYTIKPVVYGLLAARLAGVPRRIALITGLGYAFTEGAEAKRRFARRIAQSGYRLSLRFADRVIFQNPDDRAYFLEHGLIGNPQVAALVAGSGVDLAHYAPAPLPDGPVTFLMIARLLRDKGVGEFAEAARVMKRTHPETRYVMVGPLDSNPAAVQPSELEAWGREGIVEYRGALADVRPEIAGCHVFVLPSYYREGMPRTLLEAAAMGRAIITTDLPGCRETVVEGNNGLLVPPRDPDALAEAMRRFAEDRAYVAAAGAASLALARERFDVTKVNAEMVKVIEDR